MVGPALHAVEVTVVTAVEGLVASLLGARLARARRDDGQYEPQLPHPPPASVVHEHCTGHDPGRAAPWPPARPVAPTFRKGRPRPPARCGGLAKCGVLAAR